MHFADTVYMRYRVAAPRRQLLAVRGPWVWEGKGEARAGVGEAGAFKG